MISLNELLSCAIEGCDVDPSTCVCRRCGRVQHLYGKVPSCVDAVYEETGHDQYGRMVYAKTADHLFTCSRCGARVVHSVFAYESY